MIGQQSLRREAVNGITATSDEPTVRASVAPGAQFIDHAFGLAYAILALAMALHAVGAPASALYTRLVDALALPLVTPFLGVLPVNPVGSSSFLSACAFALVVFLLIHMAINATLRMFTERQRAA